MNIGGLYIGASAGYSLLNKSCSENYLTCDNGNIGLSISSGYKVNSYYYVDGSFNRYGDYSASYVGYDIESSLTSYELSLRDDYILNFDSSGFYLKYGVGRFEVDSKSTIENETYEDYSPLIVFGYNYKLTSRMKLQAEYKYSYSIDNSDLHFISLGFLFGLNNDDTQADNRMVNSDKEVIIHHRNFEFKNEEGFSRKEIVIDKYGVGSFAVPDVSYFDDLISNKNFIKNIIVNGHASSTGTELYNDNLSYKRAYYVVEYLVNEGIDINEIKIVPWGDKYPSADNSVEEGRALNRRVEIEYDQNK